MHIKFFKPILFITLLGILMQYSLYAFVPAGFYEISFIFLGSISTFFAFVIAFLGQNKIQDILLKQNIAVHLVWLAFLTALGTFVIPETLLSWTDIHRSPVYILSLGYMSGTMLAYLCWNSLLYKGLKRWGVFFSHVGVLVIIVSTASSFMFKSKGVVDLNVGGETSVYQVMKNGILLPEFKNIGAAIKLDNFDVKWSEPEVYLRLYKNEYLEKSYPVKMGEKLSFNLDGFSIEKLDYFTHLKEEKSVISLPEPKTSEAQKSTLEFTLKYASGYQHNYLTATHKKQGFIANNEGVDQLVFSTNQDVKRKDGVVYVSAKPLTFARGFSEWAPLDLPLTFMRGEAEIIVHEVLENAEVKTELVNDASKPINPAVKLHVKSEDYESDIWLSPFMKDLHPLTKEWGMFLWLKEKEPVHFKSHLQVLKSGEAEWKPFELEVNQPLSAGSCQVYQGSFDRRNLEFSGLQITCDPGRTGVKLGIWIMIIGTFILMLRRRLFKEND